MLSHIEAIIRATCQQDGSIPASRINEAIAVLRGEAATTRTDTPAKLEPVLKRQEVARLLGITPKGVDYHAKHGRLVRVKLGSRACGFSAESVRRLMNGEVA